MRNSILLGVSKIILSVLILVFSFTANGPQKPLAIWLGFVIAFPVALWGVIDFVKKNKDNDDGQENK